MTGSSAWVETTAFTEEQELIACTEAQELIASRADPAETSRSPTARTKCRATVRSFTD